MPVIANKPLDLVLLAQQLGAAGIPVALGLGHSGTRVHTYDAAGQLLDLPPAAQPVVDAHDYQQGETYQVNAADRATLDAFKHDYQTLKTGSNAIRGDMDQILAGPNSPTAAQAGQALKLTATDIKKLLTGLDMLLDDMEVIVRRLYRPDAPPEGA